jgi:hypothetical protein
VGTKGYSVAGHSVIVLITKNRRSYRYIGVTGDTLVKVIMQDIKLLLPSKLSLLREER